MALKEDLKAAIIKSGFTMTQVVDLLNVKYGRDTSVQNFSAKLKRESLKYWVFDCLGEKWVVSNSMTKSINETEIVIMKKCMAGIAIILFAILLQLCSVGMEVFNLIVGIVGLIITIISAVKADCWFWIHMGNVWLH